MKRGLFLKYVVLFVGLVTGVLVINAALDMYFVYQDNRRASIDVQREKAEAAAQRIESFVRGIENQIGWVAYARTPDTRPRNRTTYFRNSPRFTRSPRRRGRGVVLERQGRWHAPIFC